MQISRLVPSPLDSANRSGSETSRRRFLRDGVVGLCLLPLGGVGCHLLEKPLSLTRGKSKDLPPIRTAGDVVTLEIVFVDRPAGDSLLGAPLWNHVDQMASLDSVVRTMLRQNGIRAGVLGSHLPEPLQRMLGLKSTASTATTSGSNKSPGLEGRRVSIPAGGTTNIHVSPFYHTAAAKADVTIVQGTEKRTKHYANARCVFQLTATRLQDGWVQCDFLPQVHHGDQYLRPTAGADAWELDNSQQVDKFHPQRFSVQLNEGEMAVVTAEDSTRGTLGEQFFHERSSAATIQRVLLVRLCDSGSPAPVFSERP